MNKGVLFAATLLLGASVTACSGGSSTTPTPLASNEPALSGGFALTTSFTTTAVARMHVAQTSRPMTTAALTAPQVNGYLLPVATFALPDSYVPAGAFPTAGYIAVADLNTSNGSALPNPLPTPAFAQTGDPLTLGSSYPAGSTQFGLASNTIGGEAITAGPATPGQTTITISALGQTYGLIVGTYHGTAVSAPTGSQLNGPTGITFTASGAQPTAAGATPDLAISTATTPSSFVAPGGIMELAEPFEQISTSAFVAAEASTSLQGIDVCTNTFPSYILKTQSGLYVKLGLVAYGAGVTSSCAWTDAALVYEVAGSNGFTY